jgi:ribosomal protein S27E
MAPGQPPAAQPKQFPCSGCGAVMEFDPAQGLLKCGHCGHTEPIPAAAAPAVSAHPLEEFLALAGDAHLRPLTGQALQVQCSGCGSVVAFEPPQVAGACPFCGANVVTQPKAADPLVAPDGLLPFKVPKDQAQTQVRAWLQSRWFAPSALKRLARQEGIAGLYLPFWAYDADTVSNYTGQRGENYTETETYTDSDGNLDTREVTHTRWWPTAGQVSRSFRDVLIAASRSVPEKKLNGLAPWDLESLNPYEPAFLAGFKAQRYQVELPDGFEESKSVMAKVIDRDVRQDIGGDEQIVDSVQTAYSNTAFRHLLLPVWMGAYRFRNKPYQVVVNARTGEVQGERPYSSWKIASLVFGILCLIVVIYVLYHR